MFSRLIALAGGLDAAERHTIKRATRPQAPGALRRALVAMYGSPRGYLPAIAAGVGMLLFLWFGIWVVIPALLSMPLWAWLFILLR